MSANRIMAIVFGSIICAVVLGISACVLVIGLKIGLGIMIHQQHATDPVHGIQKALGQQQQ